MTYRYIFLANSIDRGQSGHFQPSVVISGHAWKYTHIPIFRNHFPSAFTSWPLMTTGDRKWPLWPKIFNLYKNSVVWYFNHVFCPKTTSGQYWSTVVMSWKYQHIPIKSHHFQSTFSSWPLVTSTDRMWSFLRKNYFLYNCINKKVSNCVYVKKPLPASTGHEWSWAESTNIYPS